MCASTATDWVAVECVRALHGHPIARSGPITSQGRCHLTNPRLRRAVTNAGLRQPRPDVFTLASTRPTWRQNLTVGSLGGAIVSHRAAAALHRLDGCLPGIVELSVARGQETRWPRTIVHRWRGSDDTDATMVGGIRCTTVERTLAQLGALVSSARVEQALDSALRSDAAVESIRATANWLRRPGVAGIGDLLAILDHPARAEQLPDSWFEPLVVQLVTDRGLPEPRLRHVVGTRPGERRLDVDFPDVKLGLEGHSRLHHFAERWTTTIAKTSNWPSPLPNPRGSQEAWVGPRRTDWVAVEGVRALHSHPITGQGRFRAERVLKPTWPLPV